MPRHFQNWLKAYVDHTSASEAPTAFHFWTGVSTIAGALRRRVWIQEDIFQWVPNFYIILVGPAGAVKKSTTTRLGMRILERIKAIRFGPESFTWQALTVGLQNAVEVMKLPTPNGAGETKHEMSCLTIEASELGTLLHPQNDELNSVLIDIWDGKLKTWTHSTRTTGDIIIQNPWLNIIGCTTPTWLRQNFPDYMIGGGLTSRIIFVYGDRPRRFVAYPSREIVREEYAATEQRLFEDLCQIATMGGVYTLTEEAYEWGTAWYATRRLERPPHLASSRYDSYLARKQTHMHKLAMILAAAKRPQLRIEAQDLIEAEKMLTSIEPDMIKVFESIGIVDESRHIHEIVSYVRTYKWITAEDLWRLCMNIMASKSFEVALRAAVTGGFLAVTIRDGKRGVIVREVSVDLQLPQDKVGSSRVQ